MLVAYPQPRPELYGALRRGQIALDQTMGSTRFYERRATIVRPGEKQDLIYRLRSGWVSRSRMLADGRRQILDVSVPGDLLGVTTVVFARSRDSLTCLTRTRVNFVDQAHLSHLAAYGHDLARSHLFQLGYCQRRQA